jgi:hypothetical protein
MHRFLIVIEKVRKNYFCIFSGSAGMHSNRKNTQKNLKNGCMKRLKCISGASLKTDYRYRNHISLRPLL